MNTKKPTGVIKPYTGRDVTMNTKKPTGVIKPYTGRDVTMNTKKPTGVIKPYTGRDVTMNTKKPTGVIKPYTGRDVTMNTKKPTGVIKPYTGRDVTINQEPLRRRGMLDALDNLPRASLPGKDARSYTKVNSGKTFVLRDSKSCQKQTSGQSDVCSGIETQSEHSVDDLFAEQLSPLKSEITHDDSDEFCTKKPYTGRNVIAYMLFSQKEQDVTCIEGKESFDNEPLRHRMMPDILHNVNHFGASVQDKGANITEIKTRSESISLPGQDSKSETYATKVVEHITDTDIIFRPEKNSDGFLEPSENAIPEELSFNPHDVDLFLKAVEEGTEKDKCVRVMVVGHYAQGKTSLTRRLSGQSIEGVESTDGIEVHRKICYKNRQQWESRLATEQEDEIINRLIKVSMSHQISHKYEEAEIDTESSCHKTTVSKSQLYQEQKANFKDTIQFEETAAEIGQTAVKPIITAPKEINSGKSKEGRYDKLLYSRFVKKLRHSKQLPSTDIREESAIDINVWDFGGQFVYYATHQIFHSKNAIYLLVFNLQEDLDNHLVDEDFSNIKFTMKSALEFWMDSILSFVGSDEGKKPTVILVGTHKKDCQGKERQRLESVLDIFSKTKAMSHIFPTQFAVECTDPNDTEVENLRKVIYELSEKSTKYNKVPAKWIPLERKMFELKEKKIVLYTEILKINAESSHPIRDEDQVKLFLKYHHEKGNIVFFDEDGLCEFLVLDAQFLIDAFKSIITSKCFYRWSPALQHLGDKLLESATLKMPLLDEIWKNGETHEFNKYKEILLKFMKRLRILAEIKDFQTTSEKLPKETHFLVPSLLKGNADEDMVSDFLHPCKMRSKVSLIIAFVNSSILQLLHQRVMAAVLAKWTPVCIPDQGPFLFRNLGVYELNLQHAGLVRLSSSGLEVTIVNLCPNNQIDPKVCNQFRRYIEMVIMSEFEKFPNTSSLKNEIFKYYIRCNHPDHGYKGSVYVHELKRVEAEHEVFCPDHYCHSVNVQESLLEWFQSDAILLNEHYSENEISDKELSKVAQAIGENWTLLGLDLGLGQDDIDCLKEDHLRSGVRTTIYFMLKEWKKRNPHHDNLKTLIIIMKQCKSLRVNWDKISNIIDKF